jgi:nucleotide-binding universal stress UspA family protein
MDEPSLFARPVVPVANEADAVHTFHAALPRVAAVDGELLAVYVVEKAGGAPDKASVEQREQLADEMFETGREMAAEAGVDIETRVLYGTDVADTIIDVADEVDATAIVFTPRGGHRWWDLFSGSVRHSLVTESDRPVVVLPDTYVDEDGTTDDAEQAATTDDTTDRDAADSGEEGGGSSDG